MPHAHAARPARLATSLIALAGLTTFSAPAGAASKQPASRSEAPPRASASSRARDDEAARWLNTANGLLQRGLYDLASEEYQKFLDRAPEHAGAPIAHYGLAVCLQRLGKIDEAIGHLEPLAGDRQFQFAAEVDLLLATCRMSRGEYDQATAPLRRLLRDHADHASATDASAMLVECLSRTGEHEQASRTARAFAQAWPDSPLRERTDLFLALAEMNQGHDEQAQRVLEASVRRFPDGALADQATLLLAQCRHRRGMLGEAADAYEALARRVRGPLAADALLGLGQIGLAEGRLDDAAQSLDALLRDYPESSSVPAATLTRARVSLEQGDAEAARARLDGLGDAAPEDLRDDIAYWLAKCDLRQDRAAVAVERLRDAAEHYPRSELAPEMAYDTAIALLRSGDDAGAGAALASFREAFPTHALAGDALASQAGVLHRLGEYDQSRALCEQFLRENAASSRAPEVEFLAAENRYLAGDFARAERAFRQFIERRGPGADGADADRIAAAQFRVAMSVYRQNRLADAEALLAAVVGDGSGGAIRPEFSGALLALGDAQFQRGGWAEAEVSLQRYVALGAEQASRDDALLKLGLCRARQNHPEQAIASFEEVLARYPQSVHALQAQFEKGQCLLALDRNDEAGAAMQEVLRAGEDTRFAPHALLALGTIARREGRNEEATRLLARAGQLGGGDIAAEADLQRGEALLSAGDYRGAAEAFERFLHDHAEHPESVAVQARLVIALARAGEQEQALARYATLGRRVSSIDAATRQAMLYEVAWCQRALGQTAEAERVLGSLLAESPDAGLRAHVLLTLGAIAADASRNEAAMPLLEQALSAGRETQQPSVIEQASYRLGACRLEAEQFEPAAEALACFGEEFRSSDLRSSALLLRGEALLKSNHVEQAAQSFQAVIDDHPESEQAPSALLRLGEATAALQLWARSESAFDRWLQDPPADGEGGELWFQARFGLGWARENQGRYDAAMEDYQRVVDGHDGPTAARAQFQIGQCLFAQQKYADAARELLRVDILYAYPEWSAAALYEAGRCLMAAGRTAEAREQFEAVRARFADTSWANLAAQRLADAAPARVPGR